MSSDDPGWLAVALVEYTSGDDRWHHPHPRFAANSNWAGLLALLVGVIYLLGHKPCKLLIPATFVCSPDRGIAAVFIVYLTFTFTWFECAQFTHLAWWSISLYSMSRDSMSRVLKIARL